MLIFTVVCWLFFFPKLTFSKHSTRGIIKALNGLDPDQVRRKNRVYDQEIPQSQTADNPVAPRGRAAQPSRDTRKANQAKQQALSSPSR